MEVPGFENNNNNSKNKLNPIRDSSADDETLAPSLPMLQHLAWFGPRPCIQPPSSWNRPPLPLSPAKAPPSYVIEQVART